MISKNGVIFPLVLACKVGFVVPCMAVKDIQDTCLRLADPREIDYICPYRARADSQAGRLSASQRGITFKQWTGTVKVDDHQAPNSTTAFSSLETTDSAVFSFLPVLWSHLFRICWATSFTAIAVTQISSILPNHHDCETCCAKLSWTSSDYKYYS